MTILTHVFIIMLMLISANLLLRTKENLGYDSYSEIAYLCLGKSSLYALNLLMVICISGIVCLYMTLFASISMSLVKHLHLNPSFNYIINNKAFYVLALSIFLLPYMFKKHVTELKIASYLLIVGILSIIIAFITQIL